MSTPTPTPTPLRCRDRCGATEAGDEMTPPPGWVWLSIAGGWRCGACARALAAAGAMVGTDGVTPDTLPPDSRGALPRETASSIAAPARIAT